MTHLIPSLVPAGPSPCSQEAKGWGLMLIVTLSINRAHTQSQRCLAACRAATWKLPNNIERVKTRKARLRLRGRMQTSTHALAWSTFTGVHDGTARRFYRKAPITALLDAATALALQLPLRCCSGSCFHARTPVIPANTHHPQVLNACRSHAHRCNPLALSPAAACVVLLTI